VKVPIPGTEICSVLAGEQFLHRAMTLINCLVGIGGRGSIGIRDCDSPMAVACNVTSLTLGPIWDPTAGCIRTHIHGASG
jgi:hypothetical protein